MQGTQGNGKGTGARTPRKRGAAPAVQAAQAAVHGTQAATLRCKATAGCNGTQAMHGAVPAVLHAVQAGQACGLLPQGSPGNGQVQAALAAVAGLPYAGHVPGARGTGTVVQVLPLPYGKGKGKVPGKPQALPAQVHAGVHALHAAYAAQVQAGSGGAQAQRYYALLGQLVRAAYAAAPAAPARAPRKAQGTGAPRKARTPRKAQAAAPAAAPQAGTGTGAA